MAKRKYSSNEIIHKRSEADVLLGQGKTILKAGKQLGITDQTYCRWRGQDGKRVPVGDRSPVVAGNPSCGRGGTPDRL